MILKVLKTFAVETQYELPVFLYFQDELDYDTLIKIEQDEEKLVKTTVQYTHTGIKISKEYDAVIHSFRDNDTTTENHFKSVYQTALKQFIEQ